jgi:hypothetical protein
VLGRHSGAVVWIGWVLLSVMARPASAQHQPPGGQPGWDCLRGAQRAFLVDSSVTTGVCAAGASDRAHAALAPAPSAQKIDTGPNSFFLKWLLVDALWIPTQSGDHTFGLIGAHLAVAHIGRVYIYGPPGIFILRTKTPDGWMLRPGFTWGFSFHLKEFQMPGVGGRRALLFLNVTKYWTEGDYRTGSSMAGLSVTWKK